MIRLPSLRAFARIALLAALSLAAPRAVRADVTLLNVSYDPTREFYPEYNALFAKHWQETNGEAVTVNQSHGGSGKQARAVIDGLEADVVTLALAYDIEPALRARAADPERLAERACRTTARPYTSTIVFLVRKGNPKSIKDWDDLAKPGVEVITPNPKTSGGARWNYLAAWGYGRAQARRRRGQGARRSSARSSRNVPVLDTGARGSTTTFVERGIGDVLIAWENEALLARGIARQRASSRSSCRRSSILAEPPVAVVDAVARRHGTRAVAKAYLEYLYTPEAQELIGKHHYRPTRSGRCSRSTPDKFPKIELFTIDEKFGGWKEAQATFFADGAIFDQIYAARAAERAWPDRRIACCRASGSRSASRSAYLRCSC